MGRRNSRRRQNNVYNICRSVDRYPVEIYTDSLTNMQIPLIKTGFHKNKSTMFFSEKVIIDSSFNWHYKSIMDSTYDAFDKKNKK